MSGILCKSAIGRSSSEWQQSNLPMVAFGLSMLWVQFLATVCGDAVVFWPLVRRYFCERRVIAWGAGCRRRWSLQCSHGASLGESSAYQGPSRLPAFRARMYAVGKRALSDSLRYGSGSAQRRLVAHVVGSSLWRQFSSSHEVPICRLVAPRQKWICIAVSSARCCVADRLAVW